MEKSPLQQGIEAGSPTPAHFPLSHLLHLFLHLLFPFPWRAAPSTPSLSCVLSPSPLFSFPLQGKWDLDAIFLFFHINLPFCAVFCARAPLCPASMSYMKSC